MIVEVVDFSTIAWNCIKHKEKVDRVLGTTDNERAGDKKKPGSGTNWEKCRGGSMQRQHLRNQIKTWLENKHKLTHVIDI